MGNKTLVAVAVAALLGGFVVSTNMTKDSVETASHSTPKKHIQGFILNPARTIAVPPLYKDDGTLWVNEDLKNHWSMLFFGYTHCPDICPTTLNVLAQAAQLAEQQNLSYPNVYFVSVDPKRDSVEMLGEYVRYFDKSFTGVTGEAKMIEALTLQAGVVFMKTPVKSENEENYLVDHSASILVINPEGKLEAYLKPPHGPAGILKSLKTLYSE